MAILGGVDLSTIGATLLDVSDFRAAMTRSWPAARAASGHIIVPLTNEPVWSSVPIRLSLKVDAATVAELRGRIDRLHALVGEDEVALSLSEVTGGTGTWFVRVTDVRLGARTRYDVVDRGAAWQFVTVVCALLDPFRYGSLRTQDVTTSYRDLRIGTAPSVRGHRWTITGPAGTPVITIRDHFGNTVTTTRLDSISGGASLVLQHDTGRIVDGDGNAAAAMFDSGDFPVVLRSRWADYGRGEWPSIRCSAGTLRVAWREAWVR